MRHGEHRTHAWTSIGLALVLTVAFVGCQSQQQETGDQAAAQPAPAPQSEPHEFRAVADIESKSGSTLTGTAVFTQLGYQVSLQLTLENATPGVHAVHIHEYGDCIAEDGSSAGGHWNPTGEEHGKWGQPPFHLGDIGNVDVGEDGTGSLTMTTDLWAIGDGSDHDVVGKSIVVHEGADDFKSQPSGAAGARVGCGVIRVEPTSEGDEAQEQGGGY